MTDKNGYDTRTLVTAALVFAGFVALLFALPAIMTAVGGENRWIAGAIVVGVLVLPFAGLWARGRFKRRKR